MSDSIKALLSDYPVHLELPVLWGNMDAFGHVNNLIYMRWFESARIAYLEAMGSMGPESEAVYPGIGPILGHTDCRFKIPLEYPDTITVGVRVTDIGEDRFNMEHKVVSHQHGKVAAEGNGLIVCVDYKRGGKVSVPQAWREAIEGLEGKSF
jgi:acyl-CoA thioester hydrolase